MYDRRELLTGAGAALASLSGGCLAAGSNVNYPNEPESGRTDAASAIAAADAEGTGEARGSGRAAPSNPALAERTRAVADEVRWFAETYPDAIAEYRAAVMRAVDATAELAGRERIAIGDVDALRTVYADTVASASTAVGGHFAVHSRLERRSEYHLDVIEKFTRRGDRDRTREELRRLREFAAGMRSEPFVRAQLSRTDIRNRLVPRLRRGERDPRLPLLFQLARVADTDGGGEADERSEAPDPATPFDRGSAFLAYAYDWATEDRDDVPDVREPPIGERRLQRPPMIERSRRDVAAAYPPVFVRRGRESTLLVGVHRLNRTDRVRDFPNDRPRTEANNGILVQRYRDPASAEAARSTLLGRATREGLYPVGDTTWERVYYERDGDVTYALVCRAGEFLLAIGANRTAWEERVDWGAPYVRTWLGGA
ncbi:hypothetical protein BRC97_01440 [Halobacteriales archaeon QS_6_71_20]|nr:MAG: hypothetical protein BRC97_01440 [Halobacteriales archaeon QS_6_71_20]